MTSSEIRCKYIDFFVKKGHVEIPSAPLVPENDPTTLFNSSGMQPLVPYLLGETHPSGKRLVNSQRSFRAQDIDEVGDNRHTTFFEMLGNWSLGDYFKREQLLWIFEFLTAELKLDPKKLYVTVFEGNESVPKDEESISIWKEIFLRAGINAKEGERIVAYPAKDNWWSRSGEPEKMPAGEPGGPDSEVFYDFGENLKIHENSPFASKKCHPNCDCGRFLEIANSVFMQYQKSDDGTLKELPNKNVDFGGGLERMAAAVNNTPDVFQTDLFLPIIKAVEEFTSTKYGQDTKTTRLIRVISDHMKAAVFMINEGIIPSNKLQGYILRRLIRRSVVKMHQFNSSFNKIELSKKIYHAIFDIYQNIYFQKSELLDNEIILTEEMDKFQKVIDKGVKYIEKQKAITGQVAFDLFQSYGFPWEITFEIASEKGIKLNYQEFEKEFEKHRQKSRTAASGMFKGGLADKSGKTIRLHTATHLLHQSLRQVLGTHVSQKGSNITDERLRFDFSHESKLTEDEIKKIEKSVNEEITKDLPVTFEIMSFKEALDSGALAFFGERYPSKVKVYKVGGPSTSSGQVFSKEICGGPHVTKTGQIGRFKILKQESIGAGTIRIYAAVSN